MIVDCGGLIPKKLIFIAVLVLIALGASFFLIYKLYFAPKDPESLKAVYQKTELKHVNLPEEMIRFCFDHFPDLYAALLTCNSQIILMDKEIARIDGIAKQYPEQGKIAEKEKAVWEKAKINLQKGFLKIEKPVKEIYVLFRFNAEKEILMTSYTNIALGLKKSREAYPYKRAVVYPAGRDSAGRVLYSQMTFTQLEQESDRLAFSLERIGIVRGTRTILMVRPGMGIERMLQCLEEGRPVAFIGIEKAHLLRKLKPRYFKSVKHWVTVGNRWFWGGYTLDQLLTGPYKPYPHAKTTRDETAAIVFTTGSPICLPPLPCLTAWENMGESTRSNCRPCGGSSLPGPR